MLNLSIPDSKTQGLYKEKINHQIKKLTEEFPHIECDLIVSQDDKANYEHSLPKINEIQKTSLFVLIYPKIERASFSLIQLGWALAHARSIIVFYEEGTLTENTLRLQSIGVSFIQFKNINDEMLDYFYNTIKWKIEDLAR